MVKVLPDLLTFDDGGEVTAKEWRRRREELYQAIVPHEYGGLPPSDVRSEGILLCKQRIRGGGGIEYRTYEVRTVFPQGGEHSFTLNLWTPPDVARYAEGPLPVVLDGDGCWRYFNDAIVDRVLQRGNIAATFNRTCVAADNPDLFRRTGINRLLPDAGFGAIAAWAWGYHRCVDVLQSLDFVRADQIAITGHSRGGKTALLAGATDERIAVTNPNDSGAGGSGLNRLKGPRAEVVEDFFRSGNIFWFGDKYREFRGKDKALPYDQHYLHALVAPRRLLVNEAYEDFWANPPGSYASCRAVQSVYALLDAEDNIGWAVREGGHGHYPPDYDALLDFVDIHFHKRKIERNFRRELFPGIEEVLS